MLLALAGVEIPFENALAKCVSAYRDAFSSHRLDSTFSNNILMIMINFNYILSAVVMYLLLNWLSPGFPQIIIIKF